MWTRGSRLFFPPRNPALTGGVSPPDVLGQGLLAGVEFVAEGAFVLLLLEGGVAGVLLLVYGQVGLGGVALETDVTLKRFLPRVHSGVTLILPYRMQERCISRWYEL